MLDRTASSEERSREATGEEPVVKGLGVGSAVGDGVLGVAVVGDAVGVGVLGVRVVGDGDEGAIGVGVVGLGVVGDGDDGIVGVGVLGVAVVGVTASATFASLIAVSASACVARIRKTEQTAAIEWDRARVRGELDVGRDRSRFRVGC